MRPASLAIMTFLLAVSLTAGATAQDKEKGKNRNGSSSTQQEAGFSTGEQQTIAAYFSANAYTPEPLPPGIQKKLARGKPLPPGIAKRSLPDDLVATLPKREGFEITIFGDRIVLLEASGLVVDILSGIFD